MVTVSVLAAHPQSRTLGRLAIQLKPRTCLQIRTARPGGAKRLGTSEEAGAARLRLAAESMACAAPIGPRSNRRSSTKSVAIQEIRSVRP